MSKRGWSVDPQQHSLHVARRIEPSVAAVALEPESVALVKDVAFQLVEPDLQAALQHEEELLPGTRVCTVATGSRGKAEPHWLERECALSVREFDPDVLFISFAGAPPTHPTKKAYCKVILRTTDD